MYDDLLPSLTRWCEYCTGPGQLKETRAFFQLLQQELLPISDQCEILEIEADGLTSLLLIAKRRTSAPKQIFLFGHGDTVYRPQDLPNRVWVEGDRLRGPGVADMKSGLYVAIRALQQFEKNPKANLGWTLVINSDEELGSIVSSRAWADLIQGCQIGLGFEPSLPGHALAISRAGSARWHVEFHGKSAHVGRNSLQGRSAIHALGAWIYLVEKLSQTKQPSLWCNIGKLDGVSPSNVVAAYGTLEFNVRFQSEDVYQTWLSEVSSIENELSRSREVCIKRHILSFRPAKPSDAKTLKLAESVQKIAHQLGFHLALENTGGVCDGNNIASLGLTTLDNLGPLGGALHSPEEWLDLSSVGPHIQLTVELLHSLSHDSFLQPEAL